MEIRLESISESINVWQTESSIESTSKSTESSTESTESKATEYFDQNTPTASELPNNNEDETDQSDDDNNSDMSFVGIICSLVVLAIIIVFSCSLCKRKKDPNAEINRRMLGDDTFEFSPMESV